MSAREPFRYHVVSFRAEPLRCLDCGAVVESGLDWLTSASCDPVSIDAPGEAEQEQRAPDVHESGSPPVVRTWPLLAHSLGAPDVAEGRAAP